MRERLIDREIIPSTYNKTYQYTHTHIHTYTYIHIYIYIYINYDYYIPGKGDSPGGVMKDRSGKS